MDALPCNIDIIPDESARTPSLSSNASAKLGGCGIFFTTKDTKDPKKFHGMNNAFPQLKPLPMKFFRGVSCFSLFKKNPYVTSFTEGLPSFTDVLQLKKGRYGVCFDGFMGKKNYIM